MRVIVFVLVVIAGVGLYVATTDRESELSSPPLPVAPPVLDVLPEPENQASLRPAKKVAMQPEEPALELSDERPAVINIGEPMDPDDPSTWPQSDNTEVINIGEPMDPDDPSTWPQSRQHRSD